MQTQRRPGTKTTEQVAARFNVSLATVYRWRRASLIKGTRVGHFILFTDTEIERFNRERFDGLFIEDDDRVAS